MYIELILGNDPPTGLWWWGPFLGGFIVLIVVLLVAYFLFKAVKGIVSD